MVFSPRPISHIDFACLLAEILIDPKMSEHDANCRRGTFDATAIQRKCKRAKAAMSITKAGGIRALRRAFATHQLGAGLLVHRLQPLKGIRACDRPLRHIHWVPSNHDEEGELVPLPTWAMLMAERCYPKAVIHR